jgi:hypothetical protein
MTVGLRRAVFDSAGEGGDEVRASVEKGLCALGDERRGGVGGICEYLWEWEGRGRRSRRRRYAVFGGVYWRWWWG